ncbi:MAG: PAS domain S-box protein [Verrucomicrobia bacterium]|nr:PAS domain S-box protein [Verrucomicrobiota bacterium]
MMSSTEANGSGPHQGRERTLGEVQRELEAAYRRLEEEGARRRQLEAELETRVAVRTAELEAAAAALRDSEAKFRALAEESLVGVYLIQDGRFRYANATQAAMLGYTTEELLALPSIVETVAEEDRTRVLENLRPPTGEARMVRYEFTALRKDGERRELEVLGGVSVFDGQPAILGTSQDITDRKRVETTLRQRVELQDQVGKIAATVPGMICSFQLRSDGSTCMPFATPAIEEIYGLSPEDVRADFGPAFARLHPDDLERVQRTIAESARNLTPWREVFRVRHPRKGELWVEGHSVPRKQTDGGVLWHGFVQDVTERKRTEVKLAEQLRELQRWHDATLGREGRILELKRQVNELLVKAGEPPRYPSVEGDD